MKIQPSGGKAPLQLERGRFNMDGAAVNPKGCMACICITHGDKLNALRETGALCCRSAPARGTSVDRNLFGVTSVAMALALPQSAACREAMHGAGGYLGSWHVTRVSEKENIQAGFGLCLT